MNADKIGIAPSPDPPDFSGLSALQWNIIGWRIGCHYWQPDTEAKRVAISRAISRLVARGICTRNAESYPLPMVLTEAGWKHLRYAAQKAWGRDRDRGIYKWDSPAWQVLWQLERKAYSNASARGWRRKEELREKAAKRPWGGRPTALRGVVAATIKGLGMRGILPADEGDIERAVIDYLETCYVHRIHSYQGICELREIGHWDRIVQEARDLMAKREK